MGKSFERFLRMLLCAGIIGGGGLAVSAELSISEAITPVAAGSLDSERAVDSVSSLPANVTFMIVDLKYSDEQPMTGRSSDGPREKRVTVLEFGDGCGAGFKVIDHMCEVGLVWKKFWRYLNQFKMPVWYVGEYSMADKIVAWDEFRALGGRYAQNLYALERDALFKSLAQAPFDQSYRKALEDHAGIVVFKRFGLKHTPEGQRMIAAFQRHYPQFLYLNDATTRYVSDKHLADALFNTAELKRFRPRCNFYPKKYTVDLAPQIAKDLECDWFVIKPVNSGRGNGVLMVHRNQLDTTLYKILQKFKSDLPYDDSVSFKVDPPLLSEYWKFDRNSRFLVEEYAQSKDLFFQGKPYDPTMRVAFTMHYDKGEVKFTWLDAYWKRPLLALTEHGTFREKHISKHAPNAVQSLGWEVNPQDQEGVKSLLVPMMEKIYLNMLNRYQQEQGKI